MFIISSTLPGFFALISILFRINFHLICLTHSVYLQAEQLPIPYTQNPLFAEGSAIFSVSVFLL